MRETGREVKIAQTQALHPPFPPCSWGGMRKWRPSVWGWLLFATALRVIFYFHFLGSVQFTWEACASVAPRSKFYSVSDFISRDLPPPFSLLPAFSFSTTCGEVFVYLRCFFPRWKSAKSFQFYESILKRFYRLRADGSLRSSHSCRGVKNLMHKSARQLGHLGKFWQRCGKLLDGREFSFFLLSLQGSRGSLISFSREIILCFGVVCVFFCNRKINKKKRFSNKNNPNC